MVCKVRLRCPLHWCMASVAAAIRGRARQVRKDGELIGLFEFCVFGCSKRVEVLLLFGSEVVDVLATFAPALKPHSADLPKFRVAAVMGCTDWKSCVGRDGTVQALVPHVNHYVIGLQSDPGAPTPFAVCPSGSAQRAAMRANWVLRATNTQGNCGIDALCYHLGLPRVKYSWSTVRREMAEFMERNAEDIAWQEVFQTCQEMHRPAPSPEFGNLGPPAGSVARLVGVSSVTSSSSSSAASVPSGASASSGSAASPPPVHTGTAPVPPIRMRCFVQGSLPVHPDVAASPEWQQFCKDQRDKTRAQFGDLLPDGEPESLPAVPPPLPPPEEPPPAKDAEVEAVALVAVGGRQDFAGWLRSLPVPELLRITRCVESFREAELRWRGETCGPASRRPVVKKKAVSLVSYRLALGHAFLQWRAADGQASRACYKESLLTAHGWPTKCLTAGLCVRTGLVEHFVFSGSNFCGCRAFCRQSVSLVGPAGAAVNDSRTSSRRLGRTTGPRRRKRLGFFCKSVRL